MHNEIYFQLEKNTTWLSVGDGIERKMYGHNDQLMLVKVRFQQGAIGTLHAHPHIQASYVASGKFELTINNNVQILEEGDGYFVPENVVHGCKCIEAGILIDVFNPHREDFL